MTLDDLNSKKRPLSDSEYENLFDLAFKISLLEEHCPFTFVVTSGFRNEDDQKRVDPMHPHSAHTLGCAVDIEDTHMLLWYWLQDNLSLVKDIGLYLEDEFTDKGHVHIQSIPPKSGKTIFEP